MFKLKAKECLYYKSSQGIACETVTVECIGYGEDGKNGVVSLSDDNGPIGCVQYCMVEKNGKRTLKFEGLASGVEGKGVGTKLILTLIQLSKEMGGNGSLTAQASPFILLDKFDNKINRPLSNMGFYYKLGFHADDKEKDRRIKEFIKRDEDVPLGLNTFADISLSAEAAQRLLTRNMQLKKAYQKQQSEQSLKIVHQEIVSR